MASFGSRKKSEQNPELPMKMASIVTAKLLPQANLGDMGIGVFPPKIIHLEIGFGTIINHPFGVPLFLETPI